MADMRLRRAALSGLRVRVPDVNSIKMVEKVVGIFSYCLLPFRPAEKEGIPDGEEKVPVSLFQRLAEKVCVLRAGLSVDPRNSCFQGLVHMISVQHKHAVGKPFQPRLDPGGAVSVKIDPCALQVIPPLQLGQEFFP